MLAINTLRMKLLAHEPLWGYTKTMPKPGEEFFIWQYFQVDL
jgi:hypothetical protein